MNTSALPISIGDYFLRSFTLDDVDAIVKYANNPHVSALLRDSFPYPYTADDAREWIHYAQAQKPDTALAIATLAEVIGGIGIHPQFDVHRCSVELGYWLGESFWGKGIASLAVEAMVDYTFATFDLPRIYASVFEGNCASQRVLEKAGFQLEGRLRKAVVKEGKMLDQFIYAIVR